MSIILYVVLRIFLYKNDTIRATNYRCCLELTSLSLSSNLYLSCEFNKTYGVESSKNQHLCTNGGCNNALNHRASLDLPGSVCLLRRPSFDSNKLATGRAAPSCTLTSYCLLPQRGGGDGDHGRDRGRDHGGAFSWQPSSWAGPAADRHRYYHYQSHFPHSPYRSRQTLWAYGIFSISCWIFAPNFHCLQHFRPKSTSHADEVEACT